MKIIVDITEQDIIALENAIWDLPEAGSIWYRLTYEQFEQLKSLHERLTKALETASAPPTP